MQTDEKKNFMRQMYTTDTEVGRMKLQSVKENLYEATTKAVLYSIEMYTKKELREWVQSNLITKLDKANKDLKREQEELEQGHIGMLDITNGCSLINDFVRKETLDLSRKDLQEKIKRQKEKILELDKKENILENRKKEISLVAEETDDTFETDFEMENVFFEEDAFDTSEVSEEDDFGEDGLEEDDFDEEDDDETEVVIPSEIEVFSSQIASIKDLEKIASIEEELKDEKELIEDLLKELNSLTRNGKDVLTHQYEDEKESLENLRTLRNTVFAHRSEDQQEISLIGSWTPEAGPLYQWASEILKYIKVMEMRYMIYACFDDFYASKEYKDKFDGCKVYVQKQIKELYVNRSSIVFEFAGELYDKEDEEFNFKKLIENMAISWDTGIRYLTVVTNEDLPELNVFFKECLSGTNKYVDFYLIDRNALRDACCGKNLKYIDYLYFKLLYHLNPAMERIYWRNRAYTRKEFASQVLYKLIKVKNMFQFDARLKEFDKYMDGIDVRKWCEQHLLSDIYFAGNDDQDGQSLASEMEKAIIDFCQHSESKGRMYLFRKAIKASVKLYFYMGEETVFSYTRSNGQTLHWHSLEDACKYMENANKFKSYNELSEFVNEMYRLDYFKIWRKILKINLKKQESEG